MYGNYVRTGIWTIITAAVRVIIHRGHLQAQNVCFAVGPGSPARCTAVAHGAATIIRMSSTTEVDFVLPELHKPLVE